MSAPHLPPPAYEDTELAALIASISDLDLTPSQPSPEAAATPTTSQPDPLPRAPLPPRKSPLKRKRAHAAYVVFYGLRPGVYLQWFGPAGAEVQVRGVRYSLHQGYATVSQARAAFEYAQQRSWISHLPNAPTAPIPSLPTPQIPNALTPNPLHGGIFAPKWHIVYAGITPGIYASYLECALNTIGISSASYDSADTLEEAQERWREATRSGSICVLTPSYS
ncbi:hypothetical protein B0H11DRAFT_2246838 [Mycena galericulata]|nr:hypothetical protein B0H11DRAFT_2246838 [Mycena galericulata]